MPVTYVLVIINLLSGAITTIPGYSSLNTCRAATKSFSDQAGPAAAEVSAGKFKFLCIEVN